MPVPRLTSRTGLRLETRRCSALISTIYVNVSVLAILDLRLADCRRGDVGFWFILPKTAMHKTHVEAADPEDIYRWSMYET